MSVLVISRNNGQNIVMVHFKHLVSLGFHDLLNPNLRFFSKHNEYCKTEA